MLIDNPATLQKTPLYQEHLNLGAKMAPFGGWIMPIQYQGILFEHAYTRKEASLFDICHMGEFLLEADPVSSGLDRIVTQNIVSMPLGSCRYGFMLNRGGGVMDDLIVYRLKKNEWLLVVNAATIKSDEDHLRENLIDGNCLKNISLETAKLDLQGPKSRECLSKILGSGIEKLKYYTFANFIFEKEDCLISRTGYTGELGYELYISEKKVKKLW